MVSDFYNSAKIVFHSFLIVRKIRLLFIHRALDNFCMQC